MWTHGSSDHPHSRKLYCRNLWSQTCSVRVINDLSKIVLVSFRNRQYWVWQFSMKAGRGFANPESRYFRNFHWRGFYWSQKWETPFEWGANHTRWSFWNSSWTHIVCYSIHYLAFLWPPSASTRAQSLKNLSSSSDFTHFFDLRFSSYALRIIFGLLSVRFLSSHYNPLSSSLYSQSVCDPLLAF